RHEDERLLLFEEIDVLERRGEAIGGCFHQRPPPPPPVTPSRAVPRLTGRSLLGPRSSAPARRDSRPRRTPRRAPESAPRGKLCRTCWSGRDPDTGAGRATCRTPRWWSAARR